MKTLTSILAVSFALSMGAYAQQKGSLQVALSNVKKEGKINIAVYREGEDFPNEKFLVKSQKGDCKKETCTFQLEDIAYGEYAVAIYQDEDGNGKLNTGGMGIPKEPFAFSNNFRPKFGGPSFEKCKFKFSKDKQVIEIALINKLFGGD